MYTLLNKKMHPNQLSRSQLFIAFAELQKKICNLVFLFIHFANFNKTFHVRPFKKYFMTSQQTQMVPLTNLLLAAVTFEMFLLDFLLSFRASSLIIFATYARITLNFNKCKIADKKRKVCYVDESLKALNIWSNKIFCNASK